MNAEQLQPLIDWLSTHPYWTLWSILIIAFVESLALAGIIVPGVLLLFLVAALAGSLTLPLELVLAFGFVGAVLGDGISFYLGYYFKDRLHKVWPFTRYPKAMAAGERYFTKHGGISVVLGRFIGPIRPVMPLVAGMMNMSPWRFFGFNVASALAWSPFYLLPGYLTGSATTLVVPERFYAALSSLVLFILLSALVFRWLSLQCQKGSKWYQALEAKRAASPHMRTLWIALTRHQRGPTEFPLASLCLFTIATLAFVLWSIASLHSDTVLALNAATFELTQALRNATFDTLLVTLTMVGDEAFLYCAFGLFIGVMLLQGRPVAAVHLLVAGLATALITHALKFAFGVARPDLAVESFSSLAYPSGHSSGATVLFGLVATFFAQSLPHTRRWWVYMGFAIPILVIALTRVMLGVHWLSDVIGGVLLGLALCAATRVCYSRYTIWKHDIPRPQDRVIWLGGVTAWLLSLIIYITWRFEVAIQLYPAA